MRPSESRRIAEEFLAAYREAHPEAQIETWDLWDGTLPEFGPATAGLHPNFGSDFQGTYLNGWLRRTGIDDIEEVRFHPTLTGDAAAERERAHQEARELGKRF